MTKEEYSINIEKLISWAKAYYVDDEPIASDEEYDKIAPPTLLFGELGFIKFGFLFSNSKHCLANLSYSSSLAIGSSST